MRLLLICMLLAPLFPLCQALPPTTSIWYPSLLSASHLQCDVFSFGNNPAQLSSLRYSSVGVYAEQRYGIPGFGAGGVAAAIPLRQQVVGLQAGRIGTPEAGQWFNALSVAQPLGKGAAAGIGVQYHLLQAAGYGSRSAVGFSVGAQMPVAQGVQAAVAMSNLHRGRFSGRAPERLAATYELGFGADLSESLALTGTLRKIEQAPAMVMVAMQYQFSEKLLCRLGVGTGLQQFVFGCGYHLGKLRLDAFASVHPQLGFSPGLQLMFKGKKEQ